MIFIVIYSVLRVNMCSKPTRDMYIYFATMSLIWPQHT